MEQINQFEFYEIGKGILGMYSLRGDIHPTDAYWALAKCSAVVDRMLDERFFPFKLCKPELRAIKGIMDRIFQSHYEKSDENGVRQFYWPIPSDNPIPYWQFDYFRSTIDGFEKVFSAELRGATTYFVPIKGIFSMPSLIDNADEAFPPDLIGFIPQKAREEWRQAGRCLAFNLLSASGFHVARAVEGMMEVYHRSFCPAGKSGQKLWKDYIADFESCLAGQTQASPSAKVIGEITQMKDDYRNPLMHPRVVLAEADARMLLANGESLIICMAQEMQAAVRSGVLQPLMAAS